MLNLFNVMRIKRKTIILDENDVMAALKMIDNIRSNYKFFMLLNMEIGNCGWGNGEESKWYVTYNSNEKQWRELIRTLEYEHYNFILKNDGLYYLTKDGS